LQNLRPVFNNSRLSIYQNLGALPRAWFVQDTILSHSEEETLAMMANLEFDPATRAIVEYEIPGISAPDSAHVVQTEAGMHRLAYDYYTDTDALLVLSEIYYPAGWKAFVDGKELPIHPVNHILRGVKVPAGAHSLELIMAPQSYALSTRLSLAGILITILAVLIGAILHFRKSKKQIPLDTAGDSSRL
jgi:hypothetical protein